jgi:hypothetical protein
MFANPLLLRADVGAGDVFGAVHSMAAGAYDHATVPFPVVAERAGASAGRPEVWFNMAPPMSFPSSSSVLIEPSGIARNYLIEVPAAGWRGENLLVSAVDTGEAIGLEFDYNTELIDAAAIDRLCAAYLGILRAVVT